MSRGQFAATLHIHACPDSLIVEIDNVLLPYGLRPVWNPQVLVTQSSRAEVNLKLSQVKAEDLVAELNAFGSIYFELTQSFGIYGCLFMSVPGLGIYRGEMNSAGSLVLTEDQINSLVASSVGNHREFMRLLRLSLGQSWDDILEPMRATKYGDNVLLLNRAG
jgi:hypothetical protein